MDQDLITCCCCSFFRRNANVGLREGLLSNNRNPLLVYGIPLEDNLMNVYNIPNDKYFYLFIRKDVEEETIGDWKIHISLPNDNRQVAQAWNEVILPKLVQYNIAFFKITKEEHLGLATIGDDQGKVVTIYLCYNYEFQHDQEKHADLINMLNEIHAGLVSRGINAGEKAHIDHAIDGSPYFSYRCDAGNREGIREGTFLPIDAHEAQFLAGQNNTAAYNPCNKPDLYGLDNISVEYANNPISGI